MGRRSRLLDLSHCTEGLPAASWKGAERARQATDVGGRAWAAKEEKRREKEREERMLHRAQKLADEAEAMEADDNDGVIIVMKKCGGGDAAADGADGGDGGEAKVLTIETPAKPFHEAMEVKEKRTGTSARRGSFFGSYTGHGGKNKKNRNATTSMAHHRGSVALRAMADPLLKFQALPPDLQVRTHNLICPAAETCFICSCARPAVYIL